MATSCFATEIFNYIPPGGDLVADGCGPLAGEGRLFERPRYHWKPADTFKERAELDAGYHRGDRPWMVWERTDDSAVNAIGVG